MMLLQARKSLSAIITCHNYVEYLPTLLDSIARQRYQPSETLVVFDGVEPVELPPNVRYVLTDYKNPFLARRDGFAETSSEVVCFLDADDCISDDYFAMGMSIKTDTNVVFSDIQCFGLVDERVEYPPTMPSKAISMGNFLHVGCLVSRSCVLTSRAFADPPPPECHEDWVFWRRIVRIGCRCVKQRGTYFSRQHGSNRSQFVEKQPYHVAKGVNADRIAFVREDGKMHHRALVDQWPAQQREVYYSRRSPLSCYMFHQTSATGMQLVNVVIASTLADYILFYSQDTQNISIEDMLSNLAAGVGAVHLTDHQFWSGTLVVTDVVKDCLPVSQKLSLADNERIVYL
jgi:glycosyltransferase involved in cell wall biosynthesis